MTPVPKEKAPVSAAAHQPSMTFWRAAKKNVEEVVRSALQ